MEHAKIEHDTSKIPTPPDDTDRTLATPPPPKKRYEIMKESCLSFCANLSSFHFFQTFSFYNS